MKFLPLILVLTWCYSATNILGFKLYSTTNLNLPINQWPLLATIPPEARSFTITNDEPQRFFALTAFDATGESEFAR